MAVFAHPDDESMGMDGTLAKYSACCGPIHQRGYYLRGRFKFQDAETLPIQRVSKLYYMVENFVNLIAPFIGDMTFPVEDLLRGEAAWKKVGSGSI